MRFDEARHDHRVFETLVDLDLLVGDPVLDLVKRADTKILPSITATASAVGVPGSSVTIVLAV